MSERDPGGHLPIRVTEAHVSKRSGEPGRILLYRWQPRLVDVTCHHATVLVRILNSFQDSKSRESNPLTRLAGLFLLERLDFLHAEVNACARP